MPAETDLPDVNVWLALSFPDHVHYSRAVRFWEEESAERLAFCRLTSLSYLRLCTNRTVMMGQPLTVSEAWAAYLSFRQLPEITPLRENDRCESILGDWASMRTFSSGHWTDAYLAGFATTLGLRLVSFDSDFSRFDGLKFLHLKP